jgi:hypothetical protein
MELVTHIHHHPIGLLEPTKFTKFVHSYAPCLTRITNSLDYDSNIKDSLVVLFYFALPCHHQDVQAIQRVLNESMSELKARETIEYRLSLQIKIIPYSTNQINNYTEYH